MAALRRRTREGSAAPARRSDAGIVLTTIAEATDAGAVLLDGNEAILVNDAAAAMRIVRRGTLVHTELAGMARTARQSGRAIRAELSLPWGDDDRVVRATAAPLPGTDQVVVLIEDLSERRRLDTVRRDFIANVSHELKTPVGALMLLAEAAKDSAEDEASVRRFAEKMIHEANRLSRLVKELLDLSRLEGGEPLPRPERVDVGQLVAEAYDRVRMPAEAAGVAISVCPDPGVAVIGDRSTLVTAVVNLLDNAVAYSGRGSHVGVGVRVREADDEPTVEISVADQGMGIAPADLDRVFERFYRADPARSRATGGTGLGLAIVKRIAANHGGQVTVWSSPGVGSTFTLHLPMHADPLPSRPLLPPLTEAVPS